MRQLKEARKQGYVVNIGIEPEFMLLKKSDGGEFVPWDALDTLSKPCYDLRALHRNLDIMTTLLRSMQDLGWDPYANDHEDGNCQFEINWTYSDALTTADRHTFFRWMVRTVAEQHGLWATLHAETIQSSHRKWRPCAFEPGRRERQAPVSGLDCGTWFVAIRTLVYGRSTATCRWAVCLGRAHGE